MAQGLRTRTTTQPSSHASQGLILRSQVLIESLVFEFTISEGQQGADVRNVEISGRKARRSLPRYTTASSESTEEYATLALKSLQ